MPRVPRFPPPGVKRLATPEATGPVWWDANNMRWRNGVLQPIGGNVIIPGTQVDGPPRDILTWHDLNYVRWAAIGTDHKLWAYRFDTQTLTDITPAGVGPLQPPGELLGYGMALYGENTYGTARDPSDIATADISASLGDMWSLTTWGQDLLFVPTQDGHLYHWSPATPTVMPTIVPGAPTRNRGVIVTDQRSCVLLGANGDPRNVSWSDQEDYTTWTPTNTNLAGSMQLVTQAYGLCMTKTPQGVLVFTSNDAHILSYVGPPFAYGLVQVAAGCPPISLRAPVAIGSVAMWPSLQRFWVWNGVAQPQPSDVGDYFYSMLNRTMAGRLFGGTNPAFSEMTWWYPDEGSLECNRYVIANYADKDWTIGRANWTAADNLGTLDNPILGALDPDGTHGDLFLSEFGWTDNGVPRAPKGEVYIESGNIVLGEGDQRHHVTQVVFDEADQGTQMVGMRFMVREQPYDAASEYDTGLYTVLHDGLMDVRFSGRSTRMRIEATRDGPFAIGKMRLVMRPGGRR